MNPFELPGPQFLLFYIVLALFVIFAARAIRRSGEGGDVAAGGRLASDAFLIAYLRGGANEAIRVAALSLVDRGLLTVSDTTLRTAPHADPQSVRRPLERAILRHFASSGEAATLFTSAELTAACEEFADELRRQKLLPDAQMQRRRKALWMVMALILLGVGAFKIYIGFERGRPVGFLILLTIIALIVLRKSLTPLRTSLGDDVLFSMQRLFAGLRARAASIVPGGSTNELALLAATFGVRAVPEKRYPWTPKLFPKAASTSTSCGSACGSSCGSSCGGGGGGCGGCGGGD